MAVHRISAVIFAGALIAVPQAVSAESGWKTFGASTASGRGEYGSPRVAVESSTLDDPSAVRIVVTGDPVRTSVSWSVTCWSEDERFNYEYASATGKVRLPYTRVVTSGLNMADFDRCELDASAYHSLNGRLSVKLQATY